MSYSSIIDSLGTMRINESLHLAEVDRLYNAFIKADFYQGSAWLDYGSEVPMFNESPFDFKASTFEVGSCKLNKGNGGQFYARKMTENKKDFYLMITFVDTSSMITIVRCAIQKCDNEGVADAIISGVTKLKLKKVNDKIDGCKVVANTYYNLGKDFVYRDSLSFIGTFASRVVEYVSRAYKGNFEADFKKVLAMSEGVYLNLDPDNHIITINIGFKEKANLEESYKLLDSNNGSSGVKVGKKGSALTLSYKL